MIEISADMVAIVKQAILSFVATVNEDGTPNLSPKASLTAMNGVLYFADIASPRTILNLIQTHKFRVRQSCGQTFRQLCLAAPQGADDVVKRSDGRNITGNTDSKLRNFATNPLRKIEVQAAKSSEAYVIKLR